MCKIEAQTVTGKEVEISAEFPMQVTIPTNQYREGMELFTSTTGKDWTPINQPISNRIPENSCVLIPK